MDVALRARAMTSVLLTLLIGCSRGEGASGWHGSMDTLSNGAVVVRNNGSGLWDGGTGWRLVEDLRIGSAGEGAESFGRIVTLEVDSAGRVYVADRQAQEIRVFDSAGAFVRTIGRSGKGPGEFVGANGLGWDPEGTLWVVDQEGERYTRFDTTGRVLETHSRALGFYAWRWEGGIDTIGRLMEDAFGPDAGEQTTHMLLRFDRTFAHRDTFPLPWRRMDNLRVVYSGGYSVAPVPFSPRLVWKVDARAHVLFGFGDAYRILERRSTGDTVRIIERTVEPIRVTTVEMDSAVAALVSNLRRIAPQADVAAQVDRSRIPRIKPAFDAFVVDDGGRLWVHPSTAAGQPTNVLDVFETDGRYLGRVTLPFPFSPYQPVVIRRDRFYAVVEDADGVQYVVRAKILTGAH
jgi:hypothetical protein